MKCQRKKFIERLLTMALAAVLCLGMAVPALAATGQNGEITGTEEHPATAAIRKYLSIQRAAPIPGVSFGFTFAKKALNGNTGDDDIAPMPDIPQHDIVFTKGEAHNGYEYSYESYYPDWKEKVIDLTGVVFPHAGAYTYTITEVQNITGGSLEASYTLFYSKAEYEITFYVKEKTGGGLYVYAIGTKIMKYDNGEEAGGYKVDATPGFDAEYLGGLGFCNVCVKRSGGVDPTNPDDQGLTISHVVSGDFADTGKYFEYVVGLENFVYPPEYLVTEYKGYILGADGNVLTDYTHNVPAGTTVKEDDAGRKYFEFNTFLAPMEIKLKHGEMIVFMDVPVGERFFAYTFGDADYSTTMKVFFNGVEQQSPAFTAGFGEPCGNSFTPIGNAPNSVAFTRTHKTIPVTGLIINNLPFIMILAIAAGALVVFILVKSRKRREYAAHN